MYINQSYTYARKRAERCDTFYGTCYKYKKKFFSHVCIAHYEVNADVKAKQTSADKSEDMEPR